MAAGVDSFDNEKQSDIETYGKGHVLEEFKEIEEFKGLIAGLKNIYNDQIALEVSCERFTYITDDYQEQPHLIDSHLESLMTQILDIVRDVKSPPALIHLAFKYLYLITKMRGYKIIVRQFPHEVADVEPVLALISQQDPEDHQTWESRYMLILWLSMVCMIPFDMVRLDSNAVSVSGERRRPVMERILDVARMYLTQNDKCRDAAAYLTSRFLTRPDVKKERLPDFLDWTLNILMNSDMTTMRGMTQVTGILTMTALLFKHGKREDLLEYAPVVLTKVNDLKVRDSNNCVIRKNGIKVIQRLGLTFLKNRVAAWRYQRGSRSLADNLKQGYQHEKQSTVVTNITQEDEEYDIPEEVEEVMEQLLSGLKDKDTVVRWSAAKGIGRVTGRLPRELANEVVGSVLELFTFQETDGAWHGGCLALAELGRRGLLLPERLPDVVPVVLKSLEYDDKRGNFSVGAHVRDAACYVCWAFARAYEPQEITPHVNDIATALIKASIYDREVNVRRAAAAAFQENVGRQGTFPHGIDILTTVDYFAVGNRSHCYLDLSVFVAQYPQYIQGLIDHLVHIKISHWDSAVRELTAKALHRLTPKSPEYMAKTVLPLLMPLTTGPDLFLRHGTILAVAEITHALGKLVAEQNRAITDVIDADVIEGLRRIAKKLHDVELFRGMGGELMRKAVTCLIEKLSLSKLPYHGDPIIELWQGIIDECLHYVEPEIQEAAVAAIPAFFQEYYSDSKGGAIPDKQEKVISRYLEELKSPVEVSRKGYSLAIGALPKFIMKNKLKGILSGLMGATRVTEREKKWAESRRDAVKAITGVCKSVGVDKQGDPTQVLCSQNIPEVYDTCFQAMQDYTLDSRGDVGAWAREAAMTGLHEITTMIVNTDASLITPEISKNVFCCLVQQACEKIDRTRAHAGNIFKCLLYHRPEIPHIPHRQVLEEVFPREEAEKVNWAAPSDTFPLFTKLLKCPAYQYSVLLGLTVSVGGLTESLVIYSSGSLNAYLRTINKDSAQMSQFVDVLMKIFESHIKIDRVSLPMLKMLNQLLSKGCFNVFAENENQEFAQKILELSKKEISRSGDPQKLIASADVFCELLQFCAEVKRKALFQLLVLMGHKYPRIRKATANKLYEALVTYDDVAPEEGLDEAMVIISETTWDNDKINEVRPFRNQLCDLLEIPQPKMKAKPDDAKQAMS
ncbi:tubulin-specific chaperone D-like [Mizuhopecten yessoensis]|uniref:Tubulin-specific chaperone D n=1 Tax=Mizuhopecten yessoensis TaxID=6573 RepID=A0A210QA62_MIZYE|nr:tubulin-specific chaperone D-like [Mizuhopecten yessoensis]OWF45618.1 Tubulin-specific chaperone D [Mizuhopecten yessoensis]